MGEYALEAYVTIFFCENECFFNLIERYTQVKAVHINVGVKL